MAQLIYLAGLVRMVLFVFSAFFIWTQNLNQNYLESFDEYISGSVFKIENFGTTF
jgi:hypothetical protein